MKIIITYASAGTGHFRSAEALYNYFKKNCSQHDIELIDALGKTHPLFRSFYRHGYPFLVSRALWLWGFFFWITSAKYLRPVTKAIAVIINRLNTQTLVSYLIKSNADLVISTHFIPSEIAAYLKKAKKIRSRLVTVITDFGVHPFWIADDTDIYVVASDFTKEQLISEGVKESSISVLGIPIDAKFLEQYDKNILCQKFGLAADKFTVLIVTGSFGIGEIEKVIDLLYKETQLLVVCARNKMLYAKLKKKDYCGLKVFGFIDNIEELMAVSDVIITKPGGLTISESLAMDLVPIFIASIPGQEAENAGFLAKRSIGMNIKDIACLKGIILDFKNHPEKLDSIKERIRKEKRPFAVRDLCDVICQGSLRVTG